MRRGLPPLSVRSKLIVLIVGPLLVALAATIVGRGPSFRLDEPGRLEARELAIRDHFTGMLEQAGRRAALALESSCADAFATVMPAPLAERLEGVAVLSFEAAFLDWEGVPSEPPLDLVDPAAPRWRIRVDGVRTRLVARAGPDAEGRFGLASYVIDSTLDDLRFRDLVPRSLRQGLQIDVRFAEYEEVGVPLLAPTGELLGSARIRAVPDEIRRAKLIGVAQASAIVVFFLTLLVVVPWRRYLKRPAGLALALGVLAVARVVLLWQDAPARLLPRSVGSAGLYGSSAAWGLLASPGDLLLSAVALYLACRAVRRFCVVLAVRQRAAAVASAVLAAMAQSAAAAAIVLTLARNSGEPLLVRPAPFEWDGRFLLWIAALLVLLGAAELWGWLWSVATTYRRGGSVEPRRIPVALAAVIAILISSVLLERETERVALEQLAHDYAPQVLEQRSRRRVALSAAMSEIGESQRVADRLTRPDGASVEFLAYEAWVHGELFHGRLKSSIDVYMPDGALLSHFGFDVPPLDETIAVAAPEAEGELRISEEMFRVGVADDRALLHAEVPVVRNGEVLAVVVGHVLDEADNLSFLPWTEPYLAALGPGSPLEGGGALAEGPHYTLYDRLGGVVLSTMRRPPAASVFHGEASLDRPIAVRAGDEVYHGFALPDGESLHVLLLPRRSPIARLATAVRWSLLGLMVLALLEVAARLFRPGVSAGLILLLRGSFYRKIVAAVLLASVPPLIGLGLFVRGYIERRASEELAESARQFVGAAQQVVEDFSAQSDVETSGTAAPTDVLLHWLRSVVGQDIHVYRKGLLQSSSKRELFSSGLLPPRLDGRVRRMLVDEGLPTTVQTDRMGPVAIPVAYAPVRPRGDPSEELIVAVPLVVAQHEIVEEASEVAEMILLATVVLVGLLAVAAALLARTVARPVRELVAATSRIAAGRYSTRLEPRTRDEVADLFRGFNAMASALGRQRADLERRRDYIETLLRHATMGVVSLDPQGRIVTLNPAASRLLRAAAGRLRVGESLLEVLGSTAELEPLVPALEPADPRRAGLPIEVDLQREREPRRLRLVRVELRGAAGDSVGTMVLLDDVTDLMRSNQLAAWAEMARAIAHEIKNPLTPIQLSTEHLGKLLNDREIPPTREEQACLETIIKQVRGLYEIAGEFSTYARLPDLAFESTDPVAFMRTVIGPYRAVESQGVTIEESYEDSPPVRVDRKVLSRALINLIQNALQAMENGGTLGVAVRPDTANGSVDLIVSDNGPGLAPEVRQRLFEPYFSTKTSGTGLGLAIVRRAVEAHQGRILVESEPRAGTTFTIRLPAAAST
jgi:signal transduction histidine kinase/HAMP domain-containing protein